MLFDERLIELVEKNDILYNRNNKCYLSISLKKKVWENIAKQMRASGKQFLDDSTLYLSYIWLIKRLLQTICFRGGRGKTLS